MADCIGTDCKREGLQAEVERLRGIVQADLEEKAEAWGEVERLRAALKPLANIPLEAFGRQDKPDHPMMGWNSHTIYARDVLAARAALSPGTTQEAK